MTDAPIDAGEHRRLALWVARKFHARDPEAVESAALMGVVKAAKRHDPERGAFSTLAVVVCRQEAMREVLRQRRHDERETSLYVLGEDGDELERPNLPSVAPTAEADAQAGELRAALAALPERERFVLEAHYGLTGEPVSLAEAAALLGCSRPWAGVLERRGLAKLRRALTRRPKR